MGELLNFFGQTLLLCISSTMVLVFMSHIVIMDYKERV